MYPSVSRQQMIDFIQSQRANPEFYGINNNLSLMYQKDGNKMRYKYPVNTKQCRHINTQELDQILQTNRCQVCSNTINSYKDLVMDIRWIANKIMHPDIESISIIEGHIFHQYTNAKLYDALFNEKNHLKLVEDLFQNHSKKNDFQEFAKIDPQYKNPKSTDQLNYDAICQLYFVKIQIPVRHKDCRHVGCYELTSLLAYRKEILALDQDKKFIECSCKCQVKIDLNRLEQELVLDKQLLNAIRRGQPHSIKFYLNPQNYELIDEHQFNNNQDRDLKEIYKNSISIVRQDLYQKFEHDVYNILKNIYSRNLNDLDRGEGKKVLAQSKLYEYQDQTFNLEDPLQKKKIVEYPVRCVCCPFNKCSDIRTYIANFILTSLKNPMNQFECPLCQKKYKQTYEKIRNYNLQDYIYLDQNLFKRLLENRDYVLSGKFEYKGRQYMLEEFQKRHKIFAADVKQIGITQKKEFMEYSNLNCVVSGQRLKIPLQLYKCPSKQYVDFNVFYEEFITVGYDFSKGLTLCKCQTCKNRPVNSINDVFFDELLQIALNKLVEYERKSKTIEQKIQIKVRDEELIILEYQRQQSSIFLQQSQNQNVTTMAEIQVKPRRGFQQYHNEDFEKRANNQTQEILINQPIQESETIIQNLGKINIIVHPDGIYCEITQQKSPINQSKEDCITQKYSFKVSNLKIEVQNSNFKFINKMEFQAQK